MKKINYDLQRKKLVDPISDYLTLHSDKENIDLLLDGTGPRFTVQLPYLCGLSTNLERFNNIHAFSGGVAAYCVFLAQQHGFVKREPSYYFNTADKMVRESHYLTMKEKLSLISRIYNKKSIYDDLPYMRFFLNLIKPEFFQLTLNEIAPNFIPYIAYPNSLKPIAISKSNGFDVSKITIEEVMVPSMKIPHIYSGDFGSTKRQHHSVDKLESAFDATYVAGYWPFRSRLSKSTPLVALTMTEKGLDEQSCRVNILNGKTARMSIGKDITSLLLNIPNRRYKGDLTLAYQT